MVQFTNRTVVVAQVEEHWSTELSANTRQGAEHLSNYFHIKRSTLDAAEKVEQISSQISHRPRPPFLVTLKKDTSLYHRDRSIHIESACQLQVVKMTRHILLHKG